MISKEKYRYFHLVTTGMSIEKKILILLLSPIILTNIIKILITIKYENDLYEYVSNEKLFLYFKVFFLQVKNEFKMLVYLKICHFTNI
jgi:hypothetical protein